MSEKTDNFISEREAAKMMGIPYSALVYRRTVKSIFCPQYARVGREVQYQPHVVRQHCLRLPEPACQVCGRRMKCESLLWVCVRTPECKKLHDRLWAPYWEWKTRQRRLRAKRRGRKAAVFVRCRVCQKTIRRKPSGMRKHGSFCIEHRQLWWKFPPDEREYIGHRIKVNRERECGKSAIRSRSYRAKHSDATKSANAKWRDRNRAKLRKQRMEQYYARHDHNKELGRAWYRKHRAQRLERNMVCLTHENAK
jgi:hypothetical protein